jgi:multiple sugar transport system permease protein
MTAEPDVVAGRTLGKRFKPTRRGYLERRRRTGMFLVLPALTVLTLVLALPIGVSAALSFMHASTSEFRFGELAGLENYQSLLADPVFALALRNSIYWMVVEVGVVVLAALWFALLLNHPLGRRSLFPIILLVPWALAPVANAVLWKWIYNSNYGILNHLGTTTGILSEPVVWLGAPDVALNTLLVAEIWKEIPFITLLMLAGLQGVPRILYRASRLDGAGSWQTFRFVTLPQLKTTIVICIVLQSIWALKSFDLVYVLTRGGPANSTTMLNYLAYRVSFQFGNLGVGAAIADILFVVMFVLALAYLRVFRPLRSANGHTR